MTGNQPVGSSRSSAEFYRHLPVLLGIAGFASIPYLGYFVHGGRDPQLLFLPIGFGWLLTWVFLMGALVLAIVRPPSARKTRIGWGVLIVYLLIAGVVGWGGVRKAFIELLAG